MVVKSTKITAADIEAAAAKLGVDVTAMRAVIEVESAGSGFTADGNPRVLFERHHFHRRLTAAGADADHFRQQASGLCNPARGGYVGGTAEWRRMQAAQRLVPTRLKSLALESASWGLFQIMGFHWKALGYASAESFAAEMQSGEPAQLEAFVRFIRADAGLLAALREQRWADFARRYNGPAYRDNQYDTRLAAAAARAEQESIA